MTRVVQDFILRRGRHFPGDVAFGVVAVGCITAGLCLLLLPLNRITGPSLAAIYDTLPPRVLGALWLAVAVFPIVALWKPSIRSRELVYMVLLPVATGWTGGLAIPFFTRETSNFWGPLVWGSITVLGYVFYWLIPLDSGFYRSLDEKEHRVPRHL